MNGNSEHGEHHPAASPSARSCSMKNQIGPGRTAAQAAQPTPPAKNSSALPNNSRSSRTGTDHPPLPRTPRLPPDRRISNRHQKHGLRSSQGRTRPRPLRALPPAKYPNPANRSGREIKCPPPQNIFNCPKTAARGMADSESSPPSANLVRSSTSSRFSRSDCVGSGGELAAGVSSSAKPGSPR